MSVISLGMACHVVELRVWFYEPSKIITCKLVKFVKVHLFQSLKKCSLV